MPAPELTVALAFDSLVPNVVEFVSQTAPARSYVIQPRVNGYLRSTNFENGMPVKRGQLLFTIDDAPFRTDVAQARAALSSARSSLVEAQAAYNRSVPLAKINAISQSQLDAATATLAAARVVEKSKKAATLTSELYKAGESSYLDRLDAERTLLSSQLQYVSTLNSLLEAYVTLSVALGGGF